MKLECTAFYFYPNGTYETKSNWNHGLKSYSHDLQEVSTSIAIFGTRKQINKALDVYCDSSGLNLDEAFHLTDEETLEKYKKHYKNKALILNIR